MTKAGLLLVVSGPSGAGKGTLCSNLKKEMQNLKISISATTRQPRVGETDGINYYFIKKEKFKEMEANGEFLETAKVYDNYYGTPKKKVIDVLKKGENIILEIDVQGAMQVKKNFPEGIFIFILPPSLTELEKRIKNRGTDSKECIVKRLSCAKNEINNYKEYDYIILNDNVNDAVNKLKAIMVAEKIKPKRVENSIKQILGGSDEYE